MKDGFIRVAAATPSLKVGNTKYNSEKIIDLINEAKEKKIKVLVFPELSITGYSCQDLFFQDVLLKSATEALLEIARSTKGFDSLVFVGYPLKYNNKLYNTASVIKDGEILAFIPKENIPQYSEFYENRWFSPSPESNIFFTFNGKKCLFGRKVIFSCTTVESLKVGAELCEDLWVPSSPSTFLSLNGATVIVNLSASDDIVDKSEYRVKLVSMQSARLNSGYIYASASDEESTTDMVFSGHNIICENGVVLKDERHVNNCLTISEIDTNFLVSERYKKNTYPEAFDSQYVNIPFSLEMEETELTRKIDKYPFVPGEEDKRDKRCDEVIMLQALGLKKRLKHINAHSVVIGLSGGLDSTLALLVTVKAFDLLSLDRKGILAITMPCFGTTKRTRSNAENLAIALGTSFEEIDITKSVLSHFSDIKQDQEKLDVTYENSQARERTQVLMDKANQIGGIVIGTGDLSELALGWATYNGDHMSMYGVNASVPKTLVRHIVEYEANVCGNEEESRVLRDILSTPVSPELLPPTEGDISQKTEEIVGPYSLHDFFLYYFIRKSFSPSKVLRLALLAFKDEFDLDTLYKWEETFIKRFFTSQFKRSCLPDGPKVGSVTFSPRGDWRMPSDADREVWLLDLESEYKKTK